MKLFKQSLVLFLSFFLVFLLQNTSLSNYIIPLIGLLVFTYLITSARKKGKGLQGFFTMGGENAWRIFILTTIILLLIFSTGGLNSNLFFLLYFLVFGIAFVLEPAAVFIFAAGTTLVLLGDALKNDIMDNFIKLASLALISPLAFFFGMEYRKYDEEEEKIEAIEERTRDAADAIAQDVEEVIRDEKGNLKHADIERLNNILEETESLREETKQE